MAMILAGDIGGTKTVLGLFVEEAEGLRLVHESVFRSQEHNSLEEIIDCFCVSGHAENLKAACFGVAGAVIEGKAKTTNIPWEQLDAKELAKAANAPRAKLLNDLEVMAYGMLFLPAKQRAVLQSGQTARPGNIAVIAAGTGLGQALLYWDGKHHHPVASEGGHCNFAPHTDQEIEMLKYLRQQFDGHVSCERVLSGPGLVNLYQFLCASGTVAETPAVRARMQTENPAATITALGLAGEDLGCVQALELFCSLYGMIAGDLALQFLAVGGVFLGGGIAPKILPALQNGIFLKHFHAKGRFRPLMESLPVQVALNERTPLLGAAYYALREIE